MGEATNREEPMKDQGWYTAFYRYAEYLRLLTNGALNHKTLYAYVGLNGRYVNNQNPELRKRSASGLSRLLHSSRYASDFQESLRQNPALFQQAATCLAQDLLRETNGDQARLVADLLETGYEQLRAGLIAEIPQGRIDISTTRLDGEIELLRAWAREQIALDADACLHAVLCSFFYLMTFGHLEEQFANGLVDESPTAMLTCEDDVSYSESSRACILRAVDDNPASIENMWAINQGGPFLIGRYVDCDAVETNGLVSRRHCSIFREHDVWYVRDEGSRYGTAVHRDGRTVWNSGNGAGTAGEGTSAEGGGAGAIGAGASIAGEGAGAVGEGTSTAGMPGEAECFPLAFGDCLVLAGHVRYWFVSLQNVERLLIIG